MNTYTNKHQVAVEKEVERCLRAAEARYNRTFNFPLIKYDLRGRTAGTATYGPHMIRLNAVLLNENGQLFIDDTVGHEVAHLISYKVYGRDGHGHGRRWKEVMAVMGLNDSRCHNMDTSNAAVYHKEKFVYACPTCGAQHALGPVRHKKMVANSSRYFVCSTHRKTRLEFVRAAGKVSHADALAGNPEKPRQAKPKAEPKVTKRSIAEAIFVKYFKKQPRKVIIAMFISKAKLTPGGAPTYYNNFKKKYENM